MFDETVRGLGFDDVVVLPCFSDVLPADVDTSVMLAGLRLRIPFLSAAMDTVTEWRMAEAMARAGGLGIVHRAQAPERQADQVRKVKQKTSRSKMAATDGNGSLVVGAAVGTDDERLVRASALVDARADVLVADSSHGCSQEVLSLVERLSRTFPNTPIVAGNVCTADSTRRLIEAGATLIKVGVGSGAACTVRHLAGVGMPQITAAVQCAEEAQRHGVPIIVDGGIRMPADVVKAIVAGADAVMMGAVLAGADESCGAWTSRNSQAFKVYRAMTSRVGQPLGFASEDDASLPVFEGIEALVPYSGPVARTLDQYEGGLRAAMGYTGAQTLAELKTAQLIQVSAGGRGEGGTLLPRDR
jgi:IMP dehydrogenase/GMP reductase